MNKWVDDGELRREWDRKKMWKGEKEGRKKGRSGGGREWKETEGQEWVKPVGYYLNFAII